MWRRIIRARHPLCRSISRGVQVLMPILSLLWLFSLLIVPSSSSSTAAAAQNQQQIDHHHSSNYAVILSSSRYWFNYRHTANALSLYQFLKRHGGFDDDHIILMLADEYAVNPRNPFKNRIFTQGKNGGSEEELYDEYTEIDYRGDDVTVENLAHVLLGTTTMATATGGTIAHRLLPVLNSDADSNILLFWTGHGGDKFFKFQDVEEILAQHVANIFRQMHIMHKYRHVLFIADTCQAFTLFDRIQAEQIPNITTIGSSLRDESSYAHHSDPDLGLTVIERYSYALRQFLLRLVTTSSNNNKKNNKQKQQQELLYQTTLQQGLVDPYAYAQQRAHVGIGEEGAVRKASEIPLSDFFVNVEKDKKKKKNHHGKPRLIPTSTASRRERRTIYEVLKVAHLFEASQPANFISQSSQKQKERQKLSSNNLSGTPFAEPTDNLFWICLAALVVVLFLASCAFDRHSPIMDKMQQYNALFDGRCKSMHNDVGGTICSTIEELWDKSSLIIHTPQGGELDFDAFIEMIECYLQRGMSTELLLLEKHPKGLRYRVRVLLDNQVMTLESIATVVNDKIVKVEPAANSDMAKFLGQSST